MILTIYTQYDLKSECIDVNLNYAELQGKIDTLVAKGMDAEDAETMVRKEYGLPYYENPY